MTYEAEFEMICAALEKSSSMKLSEEDKEKFYGIYQTENGRQKMRKFASEVLGHEADSEQSGSTSSGFFVKLGSFIVILATGYLWGAGLIFDGSQWWHHVTFIPLGTGLYLLLLGVLWLLFKAFEGIKKLMP
jgi:hypothetical protein